MKVQLNGHNKITSVSTDVPLMITYPAHDSPWRQQVDALQNEGRGLVSITATIQDKINRKCRGRVENEEERGGTTMDKPLDDMDHRRLQDGWAERHHRNGIDGC